MLDEPIENGRGYTALRKFSSSESLCWRESRSGRSKEWNFSETPMKEPTMEISGRCNWTRPAGFHEAAVASSAIATKASAMPAARAPDPTGLGETENSSCASAFVVAKFATRHTSPVMTKDAAGDMARTDTALP